MNFTDKKNELFEKYSIDPKNIGAPDYCGEDEKNRIIYSLLTCYELARKNLLKGNLTASSYACGVVLSNNEIYFGVNFNNTRCEISSICAERMALLETFYNQVKKFEPNKSFKFDYEIKYILMSSYSDENIFWTNKITPCADCLSWFNTGVNLTVNTKICSLKKTSNGKLYLDMQPLDSFLPLRNLISNPNYIVSRNTTVKRSENAIKSHVSNNELIKLYNLTYKAYRNNTLAQTSNQNIAAGAIINNEIFTGVRIDFSKRWFVEPLMAACYKGIEKYGKKTTIKAVCFIGEEYTITESNHKVRDGIVSLKTLGRLNTKFLSDNAVILTSSKDNLLAYTISDYMPGEHKFIQTYEIK